MPMSVTSALFVSLLRGFEDSLHDFRSSGCTLEREMLLRGLRFVVGHSDTCLFPLTLGPVP